MGKKLAGFTNDVHARAPQLSEEEARDLASKLAVRHDHPESILDVPTAFWDNFQRYSPEVQSVFLNSKQPLERTAETLHILASHGLLSQAGTLLDTIAQRGDMAEQEALAASLARLTREQPDLSDSSLRTLASVRNPEAAFALACKYKPEASRYGAYTPASPTDQAVSTLHVLALQRPDIQPPYELTPMMDTILRATNELRHYGIESYQVMHYASGGMLEGSPDEAAAFNALLDTMSNWRTTWGSTHPLGHPAEMVEGISKELHELIAKGYEASGLYELQHKTAALQQIYELTQKRLIQYQEGVPPENLELGDSNKGGNLSQLKEVLKDLKIPHELLVKLFRSWMAYDEINVAKRWSEKVEFDDIRQSVVNDAMSTIYRHITNTQEYVKQYGSEELVELNKVFGIVNLNRATPEEFHDQLLRWKDPKVVIKNLELANTDADWNGAFSSAATDLFEMFGREGSFYFEVGTAADVGRALVQAGAREHQAGRNPAENPTLENLIIAGHGNPEGIVLSYGHRINVQAYDRAAAGQKKLNKNRVKARFNDYVKHLGNKYRVILQACSTNGKSMYSMNISQRMELAHKVRDMQAPTANSAGFTLNEDNEVIFNLVER